MNSIAFYVLNIQEREPTPKLIYPPTYPQTPVPAPVVFDDLDLFIDYVTPPRERSCAPSSTPAAAPVHRQRKWYTGNNKYLHPLYRGQEHARVLHPLAKLDIPNPHAALLNPSFHK